jgi:hypothetical protein
VLVWWKEKEYVVGGDREVDYDVAVFVFVRPCYVAMEAWIRQLVFTVHSGKGNELTIIST